MPLSKWLGSPPFISHEWPFGRGPINPTKHGDEKKTNTADTTNWNTVGFLEYHY